MSEFSLEVSGLFSYGDFTVGLGGPNQGGHQGDKWYIRSGMDLGAPPGSTVRAAFDAHVTEFHPHDPAADDVRVYGAQIFMRAPNDRMGAFYTHLGDVPPGLAVGSQISRGDVLGKVIGFGGVTPHVHMALAEIVGGLSGGTYVGVDNLYDLFQQIYDSETVNLTFSQDGSPPAVLPSRESTSPEQAY
jgi:murein DD-endopeptidase MepM/ murein hydrolase activator NlpD